MHTFGLLAKWTRSGLSFRSLVLSSHLFYSLHAHFWSICHIWFAIHTSPYMDSFRPLVSSTHSMHPLHWGAPYNHCMHERWLNALIHSFRPLALYSLHSLPLFATFIYLFHIFLTFVIFIRFTKPSSTRGFTRPSLASSTRYLNSFRPLVLHTRIVPSHSPLVSYNNKTSKVGQRISCVRLAVNEWRYTRVKYSHTLIDHY